MRLAIQKVLHRTEPKIQKQAQSLIDKCMLGALVCINQEQEVLQCILCVSGPFVGKFCMKLAIQKAKDVGVGWVVAKGKKKVILRDHKRCI